MRGQQERTSPLFSYLSTEDRISNGYPLRQVKDQLIPTFSRLYPEGGRPSIPLEQLLLAIFLEAIYGIHGELMLNEQLDCNLLFRGGFHQPCGGLLQRPGVPLRASQGLRMQANEC
jgi:hypothetical protein